MHTHTHIHNTRTRQNSPTQLPDQIYIRNLTTQHGQILPNAHTHIYTTHDNTQHNIRNTTYATQHTQHNTTYATRHTQHNIRNTTRSNSVECTHTHTPHTNSTAHTKLNYITRLLVLIKSLKAFFRQPDNCSDMSAGLRFRVLSG